MSKKSNKNSNSLKESDSNLKSNNKIKSEEKKIKDKNNKIEKKENKKEEIKKESKEEKVVFKDEEKTKKKNSNNEEKTKEKNLSNEEKDKKINKSEIVKNEILENKDNKKRKAGAIIIILIVILAVLLIFSTIFAMINSTKNSIAKGIKINNIDISGLTYEEAKNKLVEAFNVVQNVTIELKLNDYSYKVKADDIELTYDFKKELDSAYGIGRKGNIITNNYDLIYAAFIGKNYSVDYKYNDESLNSIINEVSTSVPGIVTEYSYYIDNDNLVILPGKDGIQVNKNKLKSLIISNIKNRNPLEIIKNYKKEIIEIPNKEVKASAIDIDKIYSEVHTEPKDASYTPATETEKAKIVADSDGVDFAISLDEAKAKLSENLDEYVIPLTKVKAKVTIYDIGLEAFPTKLQEFSTRYDASNYGRSENINIATSKINGKILMPGEQFSFNVVVGERTVQEGYKDAAIFAGDQVVQGLAGGICQVSSTLYNTVLLANLQIDERYNHSFKTSYLECGRDATVVYGVKDLKFTNNRSYPVKIVGSSGNGVVTFALYGIEEDTEYKINIIPVINSVIPYNTETITDYSLAPGTQIIYQYGASGYRVTTYKEKVLNGAIVSKDVISNDTYKAMSRIIKVGPSIAPTSAETQIN